MLSAVLKPKACHICKREFLPRSSFATCCSQRCAMRKVRADNAAKKAAEKAERALDRAKREAMKTLPDLHKEARYWFNRWVRLRDADKPCVSCGKAPPDMSGLHAGRDCGHFRSVGSAGHLRYTEDNAAAQCVHCNQYLAGNYTGFRQGQIERIGESRVVELEKDNRPEKWFRHEVRAIRDDFKARCKQLEKARTE